MSFMLDGLHLIMLTSVIWLPLSVLSYLSMHYTRILGYRLTVLLGIIGVPLHEMGHLLTAVLMNHKIINFALFKPSIDGSLGYVSHSYKVTWYAPFANLLIGLARIFTGVIGFIGLTMWLRPDLLEAVRAISQHVFSLKELASVIASFMATLFTQGGIVKTGAWIVASFSILLFCVPSRADFQGCRAGVLTLLCIGIISFGFFPEYIEFVFSVLEPYLVLVASVLWSILVLMSVLFGVLLLVRYLIKAKVNAVQG